jgi:hypothetical protein
MGIYYRPEKRGDKPWRAVIIIKGARYEKWLSSEQDAINFISSEPYKILQTCQVIEAGQVCGDYVKSRGMCNKHHLRWRRFGDPLITKRRILKPVPEVITMPAPCGAEIRPTPGPRRCKMHLGCPDKTYQLCLDAAVSRGWPGWVSV